MQEQRAFTYDERAQINPYPWLDHERAAEAHLALAEEIQAEERARILAQPRRDIARARYERLVASVPAANMEPAPIVPRYTGRLTAFVACVALVGLVVGSIVMTERQTRPASPACAALNQPHDDVWLEIKRLAQIASCALHQY